MVVDDEDREMIIFMMLIMVITACRGILMMIVLRIRCMRLIRLLITDDNSHINCKDDDDDDDDIYGNYLSYTEDRYRREEGFINESHNRHNYSLQSPINKSNDTALKHIN